MVIEIFKVEVVFEVPWIVIAIHHKIRKTELLQEVLGILGQGVW